MKLKEKKIDLLDIIINHLKQNDLYKYHSFFKILYLLKLITFIFINIITIFYTKLHMYNNKIKSNYLNNIKNNLNLTNLNEFENKIRIGIYAYTMKNGGRARLTSLLLNYLNTIKIFEIYLFTVRMKQDNEYIFPKTIRRIIIKNNDLIKLIKKYKIDLFIYQLDYINEIKYLNNKKDMKILFYIHSSTFDWIYLNYTIFKTIYKEYFNSKYLVSLVPLENDYIFKKWGIKSILLDNFITYDYNSIIPSDLSSNIILMIGRANDIKKRFKIGILSMEYVIQELPQCQLKIISNLTGINNQKDLIYNLNLENNIKYIGYSSTPEIFFINAGLNLFPSISESFGLALSEVKLYGIPNILLGLDYVSISEGGTEIIYDDSPESLSLNIMKIINNNKYKRKLGKEARKSMKKFNNKLLLYKWIDLILSIYNGTEYYEELRKKYQRISEKDAIKILNNQIDLLNMRKIFKEYINLDFYKNYTLMSNLTKLN